MYPETLPKNPQYRYTDALFRRDTDIAHGFTERDYRVDLHEQDFFEINIVTRGSGMHYIEDRRLPALEGDVFILPPSLPHGYRGGKGFDVFHLLLSTRFMQKNRTELQSLPGFSMLFQAEPLLRGRGYANLHLSLPPEELSRLAPLLDALEQQYRLKNGVGDVTASALAVLVIAALCGQYSTREALDAPTPAAGLPAVLELMHTRYSEPWTVEELAEAACCSRSTFLRRFQAACGASPKQYLTRIRLDAACRLLKSSTLSVSEIAAQIGFYDASHFVRCFTAHTGVSPACYRRG